MAHQRARSRAVPEVFPSGGAGAGVAPDEAESVLTTLASLYLETDLKRAETALQEERHLLSAILDTVAALVVVLHPDGRIARFNRACEQLSGLSFHEVEGRRLTDLFMAPDEAATFDAAVRDLGAGRPTGECETTWRTPLGSRQISWSSTLLRRPDGSPEYVIATGMDITERRRLQETILEIGDWQQRRIGQDLHDGLGQHLTGISFRGRVLERKLVDQQRPEATEADKIVGLVNEAIDKTRQLSRGLLSMAADRCGLEPALRQIASDVEDLFGITCRFACVRPVQLDDAQAATHLCHLVREAVNNAIRHGGAREVSVELSVDDRSGVLANRDDGTGFPASPNPSGMGVQIMRYRASMIGGTLHIDRGGPERTAIVCRFPARPCGAARDARPRAAGGRP
jgi:two-component system CheB/CheR fusion protein